MRSQATVTHFACEINKKPNKWVIKRETESIKIK